MGKYIFLIFVLGATFGGLTHANEGAAANAPISVTKNDAPGILKQGNQLLSEGKYVSAENYFRGIGTQSNGPREAYRLVGLSSALLGQGKNESAGEIAVDAMQLLSSNGLDQGNAEKIFKLADSRLPHSKVSQVASKVVGGSNAVGYSKPHGFTVNVNASTSDKISVDDRKASNTSADDFARSKKILSRINIRDYFNRDERIAEVTRPELKLIFIRGFTNVADSCAVKIRIVPANNWKEVRARTLQNGGVTPAEADMEHQDPVEEATYAEFIVNYITGTIAAGDDDGTSGMILEIRTHNREMKNWDGK